MKNTSLAVLCLIVIQTITAQSFQEVCESSTTNGTIVDCTIYNDTLYATGFFNIICDKPVGYIAKWDNEEWSPSAINITDPGHSLRIIEDKLYIAKYEESIDSNWVYVYHNSSLEKVGEGVYLTTASGYSELPNIYDIVEFNGKLIACGEFNKVGEKDIQGIMEWDGVSLKELDSGLSGNIQSTAPVMFPHQMMVYNSELYVVGNFRYAGGIEMNGIAKWDGTSWTSMGAGFNSTVYSIAVFKDEIIVGGSFTESKGTSLNRIAKWVNNEWTPLEFGFTQTSNNDFIFVHTLKVDNDVLFIGGGLKEIEYSDGTTEVCNGIISINNDSINTFMGGVANNDIEAICILDDNQLLVGGGVFGSGYSGITQLNTNTLSTKINFETKVNPNPFGESITIKTDANFKYYEVSNQLGQTIERGIYKENLSLQVEAGMYFLLLIDENNSRHIERIIKR